MQTETFKAMNVAIIIASYAEETCKVRHPMRFRHPSNSIKTGDNSGYPYVYMYMYINRHPITFV